MSIRISHLTIIFFGFIAPLLLVACGGGGGSSGNTIASTPVAITSTNAEIATGASAGNAQSTYELSALGAGLTVGVATQRSRQHFRLVSFARKQLQWLQRDYPSMPVTATAISVTADIPCDISGTAFVTLNDADNSFDLTAGDSFSITFNNCLDDSSDQMTSNGAMTMVVNNVNGNPDTDLAWNAAITVTLNNLISSGGGSSNSANGDFSLTMATTDSINFTGSISGSSLTISENGVTETLSDYLISFASNDTNSAYTINSSGTVSSTELDGSVQFETLTTFEGIDPNYPHTGVMQITGANNSSVTLRTIDSTTVQLEIDEDGDGITDQTITTQWTVLDA